MNLWFSLQLHFGSSRMGNNNLHPDPDKVQIDQSSCYTYMGISCSALAYPFVILAGRWHLRNPLGDPRNCTLHALPRLV